MLEEYGEIYDQKIHKDPFDILLLCLARHEEFTIITSDKQFEKYGLTEKNLKGIYKDKIKVSYPLSSMKLKKQLEQATYLGAKIVVFADGETFP